MATKQEQGPKRQKQPRKGKSSRHWRSRVSEDRVDRAIAERAYIRLEGPGVPKGRFRIAVDTVDSVQRLIRTINRHVGIYANWIFAGYIEMVGDYAVLPMVPEDELLWDRGFPHQKFMALCNATTSKAKLMQAATGKAISQVELDDAAHQVTELARSGFPEEALRDLVEALATSDPATEVHLMFPLRESKAKSDEGDTGKEGDTEEKFESPQIPPLAEIRMPDVDRGREANDVELLELAVVGHDTTLNALVLTGNVLLILGPNEAAESFKLGVVVSARATRRKTLISYRAYEKIGSSEDLFSPPDPGK